MSRVVKLLVLSMLIGLCLGCAEPTADTTAAGPAPTQQVTSVAQKPTQAAKPTPTLDIGDATGLTILGGNIGAFIRIFGNPNGHSNPNVGDYHFQTYPGENVDYLLISTDGGDGQAYAHKVMDVTVQSSYAEKWSISTAKEKCEMFFPPDAHYRYQVFINNGGAGVTPTAILGFDVVYYSPSLAHEFPAASFQDANGNQTQPGLFDVQYLYSGGNTNIDSCSIVIGTKGTK